MKNYYPGKMIEVDDPSCFTLYHPSIKDRKYESMVWSYHLRLKVLEIRREREELEKRQNREYMQIMSSTWNKRIHLFPMKLRR